MLLTCIEVAGLLLVIAAGLNQERFFEPLTTFPHSGILPAAAVIFFVYLGFEEVANLTEEVRQPARDIPIALFVSLGLTTLLYIMVGLAAVALVAPAQLADSQAPLATALAAAWPRFTWLLSAIALFATGNTVLITLIASSRVAFSMARERDLPRPFERIGNARGTPWAAAILMLVFAVVLLPLGDLKILAELSSLSALVAFLAVNLALIVLRFRLPDHHRPFLVPLSIGQMPILPLAAIGSIGLLLISFDPTISAIGVLALIVVLALATQQYLAHLRLRKPRR